MPKTSERGPACFMFDVRMFLLVPHECRSKDVVLSCFADLEEVVSLTARQTPSYSDRFRKASSGIGLLFSGASLHSSGFVLWFNTLMAKR